MNMKSVPIIVLQLVTLGAIVWFSRPAPPPANPHIASADALLQRDDFAGAARQYQRAAAFARGAEADALLDAAWRAEALEIITRSTLPAPDQARHLEALEASIAGTAPAEAKLLKLVRLRAIGRLTEASALGAPLLTEAAGSSLPWLQWHMGAIRLREARTQDAITLLEAVAKAKPDFAPGLHRLGLAYTAADRHEAAVSALQRAITAGAGQAAEADLGRSFLRRKQWAEALPHLENALRAQPVNAEIMRLIAAAHYHLKRHARAAETYERAYAIEPAPRTLLSAAIAWQAGEQPARALRHLDALAPRVTEIPEILFQRALVLASLKRPVKPVLERYLTVARGVPGEAERIQQAERFLKGPPGSPPPAPPEPAPAKPHPHPHAPR